MDVAEIHETGQSLRVVSSKSRTLKRLLVFLIVVSALSCAILLRVTISATSPLLARGTNLTSPRPQQDTNTQDTRFAERLGTFNVSKFSNSSRQTFKNKNAKYMKQNRQRTVKTRRVKNEQQNQRTTIQTVIRARTAHPKQCSLFFNTRNKSIPVVVKRPPWFDLTKNATSDATKDQRVFYLTAGNGGRLGNQLFVYATLFGVAWRNSRIPLWNNDREGLREIFTNLRIDAEHKSPYINENFTTIHETNWLRIIDETNDLPPSNIHMHGWLQHKSYFAHVDDQLRLDFTFSPDVMRQAQRKLDAFNASSLRENGYVRVVIHVRRGDFSWTVHKLLRDQPGFFNRSMAYFTDCRPKVHFIVISDDVSWCRRNIFGSKVDFMDDERSPAVDLAIASLCDHAIITVGTFGWWVAWFANGVTVELAQDLALARRPPVNV